MKKKQIKAWAGFVNDELNMGWIEDEKYKDKLYGIFKTRTEARKHYEDVRKVKIILEP